MRSAVVHLPLVALLIGAASTHTLGAELKPETVAAWTTYVRATEARIARELRDDERFLALDFQPRPESVRERRDLVAGAVVVTTPQTVSVADTRRAVKMYQKLNIPVIGVIENMSYFVCGGCGTEADIFGKGGGEALALELGVPFLGAIPLSEPVRAGGDAGTPIVFSAPDSPPALALADAAARVAQQVSIASYARKAIPLTPVN